MGKDSVLKTDDLVLVVVEKTKIGSVGSYLALENDSSVQFSRSVVSDSL